MQDALQHPWPAYTRPTPAVKNRVSQTSPVPPGEAEPARHPPIMTAPGRSRILLFIKVTAYIFLLITQWGGF